MIYDNNYWAKVAKKLDYKNDNIMLDDLYVVQKHSIDTITKIIVEDINRNAVWYRLKGLGIPIRSRWDASSKKPKAMGLLYK